MNLHLFSPYIRLATDSFLSKHFIIRDRILFDYELIFILDGQCKITIDKKEYLCQKDQIVFIPPNVLNRFETLDQDFHQPHIHFDIIYDEKSEFRTISFQNKTDMNENQLALISENVFQDQPIPYVFTPVNLPLFQKTFFDVIEAFQSKKNSNPLLYKAKFLQLLHLILEQFNLIPNPTESVGNNVLQSVKNFIDNSFKSIITLDMLEKQFYMNKYTLLRSFKTAYGLSVIQYYRQKRIDFAKKRLLSTTLSVTAISEELNFSDVFTFSRFFKIHTGVSPMHYKSLHAKNDE